MRIVALIPARAGSKRIPGKNTKLLGGKPLIQWTIEAANESGFFDEVVVSTNDPVAADVASACGVTALFRPAEYAADDAPDFLWVTHVVNHLRKCCDGYGPRTFSILRPTSPFRTADTIRRAMNQFRSAEPCDSLRAVQPVREHPGKMWVSRGNRLQPIFPFVNKAEWHSSPTQELPMVYVQNSSLEIAAAHVLRAGSIAGTDIVPFFTEGYEGFSIDYPEDWARAEQIVAALQAPSPAQ